MKKLISILSLAAICASCQSAPKDGWDYKSFNKNTSAEYLKADCLISRRDYNCFVLFQQINGEYVKLNEFKTLDDAKKFAGNLNHN